MLETTYFLVPLSTVPIHWEETLLSLGFCYSSLSTGASSCISHGVDNRDYQLVERLSINVAASDRTLRICRMYIFKETTKTVNPPNPFGMSTLLMAGRAGNPHHTLGVGGIPWTKSLFLWFVRNFSNSSMPNPAFNIPVRHSISQTLQTNFNPNACAHIYELTTTYTGKTLHYSYNISYYFLPLENSSSATQWFVKSVKIISKNSISLTQKYHR